MGPGLSSWAWGTALWAEKIAGEQGAPAEGGWDDWEAYSVTRAGRALHEGNGQEGSAVTPAKLRARSQLRDFRPRRILRETHRFEREEERVSCSHRCCVETT